MTLTKLKNATNVMYNGYRPWAIIEVEKPEALLLAGWIKLGEAEESKELTLAEMTKAELLKFAAEKGIDIQNPSRTTADAIRAIIAEALEKEETPEKTEIDLDTASDEELKAFAQELGVEIEEGEARESLIEKIQKAVEEADQE